MANQKSLILIKEANLPPMNMSTTSKGLSTPKYPWMAKEGLLDNIFIERFWRTIKSRKD